MSHFIQDNQVIVKTFDGKHVMFIKGGDNNVTSGETNRRLSYWSMWRIFGNKEQFDAFVENAVKTDIHGGSWQFASLKNKRFSGYTEYENLVFKRFDNAWQKALLLNRCISDVTIDNVREFERDVAQLLLDNKFSLKDQDGYESKSIVCSRYRKDEEARINAVENLNSVTDKYLEKEDGSYRRYCSLWSKTPLYECLRSSEFCSFTASLSTSWLNPFISIIGSSNVHDITNENFSLLLNIDIVHLIDNYWLEHIFKNYPVQFKYLLDKDDSLLFKQILRYQELLEPESHSYKHILKNVALIESFLEEYESYTEIRNEVDAQLKNEAPQKFIDTWNKLINYCWYKQTWSTLPYHMAHLKEYIDQGVNIDEIKSECESDLREIIQKHRHQNKKNQKAIERGVKEIFQLYFKLLDDLTIERFVEYFGLKLPIANNPISNPTSNPSKTINVPYTGTLF